MRKDWLRPIKQQERRITKRAMVGRLGAWWFKDERGEARKHTLLLSAKDPPPAAPPTAAKTPLLFVFADILASITFRPFRRLLSNLMMGAV